MDIQHLHAAQRAFYAAGRTRRLGFRRGQLERLRLLLRAQEEDLLAALKADLNKSRFEGYMTELGLVHEELDLAIRELEDWAAPSDRIMPLAQFPSRGQVLREPYGVALILAPWNYPLQLTLNPLIAAIAAGNCAVVKPSAYAPATAAALARLLGAAFRPEYVAVVQGGREANTALLEQPWDFIFFTGSVAVGKVVMEAASRHLTPVALELGGKSPAIVDRSANLRLAAKRIIWGKTVNSGQTCVAPDYVLADRRIRGELLFHMKKQIALLWGHHPLANPDYPRIVNEKHFHRLLSLMAGEPIYAGGDYNEGTLQIEPTLLDKASPASPVMQEEIFGPLLPVLAYEDLPQAIRYINRHAKPLALYLFSEDKVAQRRVLAEVSFGGGCVNDTLVHLATTALPFGGVGGSGMGRYHGKYGFDTFTHEKGVLYKSTRLDIPLRYPPYPRSLKLLKTFLK